MSARSMNMWNGISLNAWWIVLVSILNGSVGSFNVSLQCQHIAVSIWVHLPLRLCSSLLHSSNFKDCWLALQHHVSSSQDREHLPQTACFILWHLWKDRNFAVFNKTSLPFYDVISAATKHQEDFNEANSAELNSSSNLQISDLSSSVPTWNPPPLNLVKINFDAATDIAGRRGSIVLLLETTLGIF